MTFVWLTLRLVCAASVLGMSLDERTNMFDAESELLNHTIVSQYIKKDIYPHDFLWPRGETKGDLIEEYPEEDKQVC